MQNKHFIIIHNDEDRNIFINKLKYPKTIYHVGNNPEPDDICIDKNTSNQTILINWIIRNYNNLPDFVIYSQSIPDDHVHEPLLAIESTLTAGYGSFCYARQIYNQFSSSWVRLNPIRELAHKLGLGFTNDNNISKNLYCFGPGEIFYVSRQKIHEKPISFYENFIYWNTDEKIFQLLEEAKKPNYLFENINKYHPELKELSRYEKFKKLIQKDPNKTNGYSGWSYEALWMIIWANKDFFNLLDVSQECLGNKLYFDLKKNNYDINYKFSKFPYTSNISQTIMNFKLLENDWFDLKCPAYQKWRKTLIEKTVWEGQQRGFDGLEYVKQLEQNGIKHISF